MSRRCYRYSVNFTLVKLDGPSFLKLASLIAPITRVSVTILALLILDQDLITTCWMAYGQRRGVLIQLTRPPRLRGLTVTETVNKSVIASFVTHRQTVTTNGCGCGQVAISDECL